MKKNLLCMLMLGLFGIAYAQPEFIGQLPTPGTDFYATTDYIYFRSGDSLLRTDGTPNGTLLLKTGLNTCCYRPVAEFNSRFFFSLSGYLWSSDGSPGGTVQLAQYNDFLNTMGGFLYFTGTSAATGSELYKTDGTVAGTSLVKDIYPGATSGMNIYYSSTAVLNNELYFPANDGVHGFELWKTDGTGPGTVLVKDIYAGSSDGILTYGRRTFFSDAGHVYFVADNGTTGFELWKTDGTLAGTQLHHEFIPGSQGIKFLNYLDKFSGDLHFLISYEDSFDNVCFLWKINPLREVVTELAFVGRQEYPDGGYIRTDTHLYFAIENYSYLVALWATDGTPGGTVFQDIVSYGIFEHLMAVNNFAISFESLDGYEDRIFRTDALANETKEIGRISSSDSRTPTSYQKYVLYADNDGPSFYEYPYNADDYYQFMELDVVSETTSSLRTLFGISFAGTDNIIHFKNTIYFTTYPGDYALTPADKVTKLWKYDPGQPKSYFTWIDADNDTDLKTIQQGDTLVLLPGKSYNIRYNTQASVGSVVFSGIRTENVAPYAAGGDNNGNYNPWNGATPGSKSITTTVYSGPNGTGSVIESRTIQFVLADDPGDIDFILINANTNQEIDTLRSGHIIDVAAIGTNKLNIKAHSRMPSTVSVVFDYNGVAAFRKENTAPYALFGDSNGNYAVHHYANGNYTLKATPYTGINGSGTAGQGKTISFQVVNSSARLSTFPNPVENTLFLTMDGIQPQEAYQVTITDLAGNILYQASHQGTENAISMDQYTFITGVYIIKVVQNQHTEVRKVFKK